MSFLKKYWIPILILFLIGLGAYFLIVEYRRKKQAAANAGSVPSATGNVPAVSASKWATNSATIEPDWANMTLEPPQTKAQIEAKNIVLSKGKNGEMTLVLQRYLNSVLPSGERLQYDAIFGPKTEAALAKVKQKTQIAWAEIPANFIPPKFYKL